MYKISVPIITGNSRFPQYSDKYISLLKQAGVKRVFLCGTDWFQSEKVKEHVWQRLKTYAPIYKEAGFEVGTWINSFGHGGTCGEAINTDISDGLQRMVSLDGIMNMGAYCPLCENQQALAKEWIKRLGETGVDLIMLDDDYRYAFRNNELFCACDKHRALFEKELGEPFDAKRMKEAITTGGPNKWRDTWLRVQGNTLNDFAKMLREALDEVNPQIQMSACSVLSTWDVDGIDSLTLAKSFAGNTPPFLRLIGAAYWPALRNFQEIRLGAVCEYERLQQYWCKDSGVEIFCEGDTYPRPSYTVPVSYLEGFDEVMRAAGTSDGILKYMFDYTSSPDFEMNYFEGHMDHQSLYEAIHENLSDKEAVGVTVFAPMKTLALSHKPGNIMEHRCIPASLRFVTDTNIPVRYDAGEDATIIFGDAGELAEAEQLHNGAILDITAAEALTRRGFDVGLRKVYGTFSAHTEEFTTEDEIVGVVGGCWYDIEISEDAKVDSWLLGYGEESGKRKVPATYTYENAEGQKFVVYCFSAQESFETGNRRGLFRTCTRASQIRRFLPWLSGRKMDAICEGAPDLYMMVKRDEDSLSVGLWNFGIDTVKKPVVHLGQEWSALVCNWGKAELSGDTVETEPIPGHSFVCFTLNR